MDDDRATQGAATDRIAYPCIHGAGATHLDSFAHIFFNGLAWNGYPVSTVVSKEKGAIRNSVLNMKNGIVTRAVLFDIPRLKGVPYLEPGTRIFPEDLEAWEKKAGVKSRRRRRAAPPLGTLGAPREAGTVADRRRRRRVRQLRRSPG